MACTSFGFTIWSEFGPSEGFFPLIIAIIIMGLSIPLLLKSLFASFAQKTKAFTEEQEKPQRNLFKVSAYGTMSLLYGILMPILGFLVTSTLFLLLIIKWIEKKGWRITLLVGSVSIVASYVLFVKLLDVRLPQGLIKF